MDMFGDSPSFDLFSRGRAAAKVGEKAEAIRLLERCLSMDPPFEERMEALYWLSEVTDDSRQKRQYLEEILANNLGDARARRKLAILDGKLKVDEIVDPDHIPAPLRGASQEEMARAFTCPRCGGRRVYAPDGQTLLCEYCDENEKVSAAPGREPDGDDFLLAMATAKAQRRPIEARSITCKGCGTLFLLPPEVITQTCPYCAAAYALEQVELRQLDAPDGIIPFKLDESAARSALKAWLQEKLPDEQWRVARGAAVYLPAWVFAMGGQIDWNGRIYRNKKWLPVSGSRVVGEDNIVVPASQRPGLDLEKFFGLFDLGGIQPFDLRYLANWMAETFQISAADASLNARSQAIERIRANVQGVEMTQDISDFKLRTSNMLVTGYRLVLLPVWLNTYVLDEETGPLTVLVNGQTGQVQGKLPAQGLSGWLKQLFG
jgi:hypothetical protein